MLYSLYEAQHTALTPFRYLAELTKGWYGNPFSPFHYLPLASRLSAASDLFLDGQLTGSGPITVGGSGAGKLILANNTNTYNGTLTNTGVGNTQLNTPLTLALASLVNNAAGNFYAPSESLSENAWKSVLEIDLYGTFFCSQAVLPIKLFQTDPKQASVKALTDFVAY